MPPPAEATFNDEFVKATPWDTFEHSAFRLERLPQYLMKREAGEQELYLSGVPRPEGYNAAWHADLRRYGRAGKVVQRVRVVVPPLTPYQRLEFDWAYPGSLEAGEDIRVLDLSRVPDVDLPDWDFWLFDDEVVLKQNNTDDGTFLGREILTDADPALFRRYRRTALEHAAVFWTYRALTGN